MRSDHDYFSFATESSSYSRESDTYYAIRKKVTMILDYCIGSLIKFLRIILPLKMMKWNNCKTLLYVKHTFLKEAGFLKNNLKL